MTSLIRRLLGHPEDAMSYEEARELARHENPDVRRELAARPDIVPEILYYLAEDPDPRVRRAIIANAATPPLAHLLLAHDDDEDVRCDLAAKVARLAPQLSEHDQGRVRAAIVDALGDLARDQIPRVRQILSEALKDVAAAPAGVIRQLARDVEVAVATPVLEFSPVLTDEDLLEIIASSPVSAKLTAISRRRLVTPQVADAIADSDDEPAVCALLANTSAQIREETLDRLIDEAPRHAAWHEPLVRRPGLHGDAAVRLARFVADNLILVLQQRDDLPPEAAREVARVVHRRLGEPAPAPAEPQRPRPGLDVATVNWHRPSRQALERASFMAARGLLTEKVVEDALFAADQEFVTAALSVLGGLAPEVVSGAILSSSPQGILAVAWKSGLSPQCAVHLQAQLGRISPQAILRPSRVNGYALKPDELEWQLDLFRKAVSDGVAEPGAAAPATGAGSGAGSDPSTAAAGASGGA